ncbi:hypothetical protein KIK06_03835 [Nocardiopsis sp. EMB25]|uniref:hypothetical protein n=1 Tax=Nocardiopsis sp. EMB25 TaxID=2835867 RepID=UPI002283C57F|nr:hypothetical protein [Nocardiopsis sp. EMB25]MCY9783019.1 hypothetical protein [Nocardiopsis sp. EMB25]
MKPPRLLTPALCLTMTALLTACEVPMASSLDLPEQHRKELNAFQEQVTHTCRAAGGTVILEPRHAVQIGQRFVFYAQQTDARTPPKAEAIIKLAKESVEEVSRGSGSDGMNICDGEEAEDFKDAFIPRAVIHNLGVKGWVDRYPEESLWTLRQTLRDVSLALEEHAATASG